jgi:hypothetical protein
MGLTFAENARPFGRNCWNLPLGAAFLFGFWLTGCNNACFTFTSNPPAGTINIKATDPSPTCTLTKVNGAVRLTVQTVPMCNSCSGSGRIQHIFVSIRGIEVHPGTPAEDDSSDWHELAPQFTKRPLQVDLARDTADRVVRELSGEIVAIPAGIYRQVRIRFVPNQSPAEDQLPERNACGGLRFSCVVMGNGRTQPLLLDGGSPELRITSDRIEGGSFLVAPDTDTDLTIELTLVWGLFSSADQGLRLFPGLTGSAKLGRTEFDELAPQRMESFTIPSQGRRLTQFHKNKQRTVCCGAST